MDIQLAKYKELIEQQLEELTAEDVLGQSAQKTVELYIYNVSAKWLICALRRLLEHEILYPHNAVKVSHK